MFNLNLLGGTGNCPKDQQCIFYTNDCRHKLHYRAVKSFWLFLPKIETFFTWHKQKSQNVILSKYQTDHSATLWQSRQATRKHLRGSRGRRNVNHSLLWLKSEAQLVKFNLRKPQVKEMSGSISLAFLPLVLPLMMPSWHLREKENILLLPPADRLPFLRESVWGKANESCLGERPFLPNITLTDMFIFFQWKAKKMFFVLLMLFTAQALWSPAALLFSSWRCFEEHLVLPGESFRGIHKNH